MLNLEWYKDKKVLVTGSSGFIGSHLTEELVKLGANVRAFVKYNFKGSIDWLKSIKNKIDIYFGDLIDFHSIKSAMNGMDIVFHLAASISIPYSYIHPKSVFMANALGTLNLVIAAKECKPKRVIHVSSSEVFGTSLYTPMDEKHPLQAQSPYSATKIAADKICEAFYKSYSIPIVTIRPFNTYGPRQSPRAIIPTIILQLIRNDRLELGNLEPKRDFTYVKDTINGLLLGGIANTIGEEINLGSGTQISIRELAKLIMKIMSKECEIVIDKKRIRPKESDVMSLISDNKKAREILGWKPKIGLEEGLKLTINWFKENEKEYEDTYYL